MNMYNNQEQYTMHAIEMVQALDNTGIRTFMYFPQTKTIKIPENTCAAYQCKAVYENMPQSFADDFVHQDDQAIFNEMYYKIDCGEKTTTAVFHSKDYKYCHHVTLTTVSWLDDGRPYEVFGLIENQSELYRYEQFVNELQSKLACNSSDKEVEDILKTVASAVGSQYNALYYVWLEEHTYRCFQEKVKGVLNLIDEEGDYNTTTEMFISTFVIEKDRDALRAFVDIDTLAERLGDKNSISHDYRSYKYGWNRGQFIAGKRDESGKLLTVIYAVSDINEEVIIKKEKQKAEQEALHDPLTGLWNRKAFDEYKDSEVFQNNKAGLILLDIDGFKGINDLHGHEAGDKVIKAVSKHITNVSRQNDMTFRLGGDEFAMLLQNCGENAWISVCKKIVQIHTGLKEEFDDSLNVTISVGLCFNAEGYTDEMYMLADRAMYNTKAKGKGGCTLIGMNGEIKKEWLDQGDYPRKSNMLEGEESKGPADLNKNSEESYEINSSATKIYGDTTEYIDDDLNKTFSMISKNVMRYNNVGTCRIEIFSNENKPRRLICGETAKSVMGIPKDATPEECYIFWRDRIDASYIETLLEAEQSMIKFGQTECTFSWNHPDYGKIFLRCGGYSEKKDGMIILSGYCHTLKDTHIIEKQDDQARVLKALNETFVSSYYLDLENETAEPFKIYRDWDNMSRGERTLSEILTEFGNTVVDPRDREIMRDFLNMNTLQARIGKAHFIDAEYRNSVLGCWCRARLLPVKYDQNGKLSHVLITITALDSEEFKEAYTLNYNRRSLVALFDNLPCGAVMYEWNGHSLETVHISKYYKTHSSQMFIQHDENNKLSFNFSSIHPDDQEDCYKAIKCVLKDTHELHQEYRVWSDRNSMYVWERVDAIVVSQPNGVQFIYAVYTDITQRKEQELRLKKNHASLLAALNASNQLCYEYDPIRHMGECLTDENFFGLPKVIENYPDSLKELDLFHPEDADKFIRTAHLMDEGTELAQCDVRIKKDGSYCWYSCAFNKYFDSEKERHVAILTVVDISLRMAALKNYEDRLHSMATITENTLCMTMLNLTKNTYEILECRDEIKHLLDDSLPLEDFVMNAAAGIVGEESQKRYREWFNPKYLLQQANEGNMRISTEYILRLGAKRYEWVHAGVDLVRNPVTGEVSGTAYNISAQTDKMNKFLLERTLEHDYLFVAMIFVDTDEFYLFNPSKEKYSKRMENYWGIALDGSRDHCSEETFKELQLNITKENILNHLEKNSEYRYIYNGIANQQMHRLEIGFCYADPDHTMLLASMRNITDAELLENYRHDSEHDMLTDLYNRRTMFRKCRELLDEHPEDSFVMIHADIKHFRLFNTFFGDVAGDKLLCDMANQFRWMGKDYDYWVYGRIDADVFAAFLPYNEELYKKHLTKILESMKTYRLDFLIEPMIGMYFVTDRDMSIEAMFTRATLAAKMVQPDTPYATVVFDETMEKTLKDNQEILNEMQTAIDGEQFQIYLQPKYSLRTNKPVGAEALVRWIHPVRGLISPSRFIPLFESNGFIAVLDRYMWERTCRLLSKWKNSGQQLLPISVNVSRISAYSQDTVAFLKALVEKYDIEPKYLELELTESAYVESPDEIRSRLRDLQEYGFKILMDDFGSGYSSLNTLKDIPIDILKLDMKFLSSTEKKRGSMILSSVVRMSKLLNLAVIAEGVEEESQADYLRSIGCEYVQGFLFDRPMPVSDYEDKIFAQLAVENTNEPESPRDSRISGVLLDPSDTLQMIDDSVPSPVIMVGYHDDEFNCLRMNKAFINKFGLKDGWKSADILIKEHFSSKDYDRMLRAYKKCSETKEPLSFRISWENDDGKQQEYLTNAVYEGNIGIENVLIVSFIDIEPDNLFE